MRFACVVRGAPGAQACNRSLRNLPGRRSVIGTHVSRHGSKTFQTLQCMVVLKYHLLSGRAANSPF